ncbi:MAG: VWA domain-containing protein [Devosia sp.]
MTFIWQDMLWLLLLVPALVALYVWVLRRRKVSTVRYANLALVKAALGKGPGWRRHIPPVLMLLAITVLIIAVARPAAVLTVPSARSTVILAMDVSGSMRAEDITPNRMVAAQLAAKQFIAGQPANVEIGIVAFASVALLVQAPTIEREPLYAAIDRFELRRGTAVGSGILTSLDTIFPEVDFYEGIPGGADDPLISGLGPPTRGIGNGIVVDPAPGGPDPRSLDAPPSNYTPVDPGSYENAVIILLTDGATTAGPDPIKAGQMAADFGVRIFTVGFGSPDGAVVNFAGRSMRAELDATTLMDVAARTDGQYFEATSAADLTKVYQKLATRLVGEKKLTEIAFIFAGIGALFAMLGAALSLLWYGRLA